jgi:amino acid permease
MHKPWRGQRRASPEVNCNSKSGLWLTWGFTLIWNLLSLLGVTAVPRELAAGNFFFLLILVFPLIGIYLLYQAINTTLDWRRFGPLTLPHRRTVWGDTRTTIGL